MNTTEVERKKEKKLDRNHWMCRIQAYTFGIDAPTFYMGYCPFFWMTWLALVCFPFVAIFRFITIPAVSLYSSTADKYVEKRTQIKEKLDNVPLEPTHTEIASLGRSCESYDWNPKELKYYHVDSVTASARNTKRIYLWFSQNPDWYETHYPASKAYLKKIQEEDREERARIVAARERREAIFKKLRSGISPIACAIFKVLIPIVLSVGAISAIGGLIYGAMQITLQTWAFTLTLISFVAAASIFIYLIFDFLRIWLEYRPTRHGPSWIARAFSKVMNAFATVIEFIHDTVSMTYKQECPLIIWGEETGPIEKRNK